MTVTPMSFCPLTIGIATENLPSLSAAPLTVRFVVAFQTRISLRGWVSPWTVASFALTIELFFGLLMTIRGIDES